MEIKGLIKILAEQNAVYSLLIELAAKMQAALKENNIEEIDSLIKIEMALVMKLASFEKKRMGIANSIAKESKINPSELTISEIKKLLDEKSFEKLEKLELELNQNIKSLVTLNESNKLVIKHKLDLVDFSLQVLGISENIKYSPDNKIQQKQMIDEKV